MIGTGPIPFFFGVFQSSPDRLRSNNPVGTMNRDNELDLHGFRPQDLSAIVKEFLEDCRRRRVVEARIIHGRGRAQLARSVHSLLARLPGIQCYAFATQPYGGMGATWVRLSPPPAMAMEPEQDNAHSKSQ